MKKNKSKSPLVDLKKLAVSKTFIQRITTLHGTNEFSNKSGASLVLWALLMIINVFFTVAFIMIIKERFHSDQIVTKIYSDCAVEKVPFPAVSICNFNLVSLKESKNIEKILLKYNISAVAIQSFFFDLHYLRNFGEGSDTVGNHSDIMDILREHYFNMETVMEEVHQKCSNLLVHCEFNSKDMNCEHIFTMIQTADGLCCTFNYNGVEDDNDPLMVPDEDLDYYYEEAPDGETTRTAMISNSQSGRSSGLKAIINLEPNDYPSWSPSLAYGAKIMLNDPNDFPETRVSYAYLTIGRSMDIKVEPKIFQCEATLRSIDPIKRGCWFHDEVALIHTNRYSWETCSTECRIRSYAAFCGCVPYIYPVDKSTRVCELSDLPCIHYMKVNWAKTKTPCEPPCYKECFDKDYSILTDTVPFLSKNYPEYITKTYNVSELAAINVYYMKSTCSCYKMSLLVDFSHFIATYGGIFSLAFGASIVTFLELFYLFLASLLKVACQYCIIPVLNKINLQHYLVVSLLKIVIKFNRKKKLKNYQETEVS